MFMMDFYIVMQIQLSLHVQHKRSQCWNMVYLYYCLEFLWHADVTRMCIAVLHKLCYITVQWTAGLRNPHTLHQKYTQFKKACTQHKNLCTNKLKRTAFPSFGTRLCFVLAFLRNYNDVIVKNGLISDSSALMQMKRINCFNLFALSTDSQCFTAPWAYCFVAYIIL